MRLPLRFLQRSDRKRLLDTTIDISRVVVSAADAAGIVAALLYRVREIHPCDQAAVVLMRPEPPHTLDVHVAGESSEVMRPVEAAPFTLDEVHPLYEGPQWIRTDSDEVPHYLAPLARAGARGCVVVPLLDREDLIGVVALGHSDPANRDEHRAVFVRLLADQTGIALRNAQLAHEIRNLSFFDGLTGLPNRELFQNRLEQALIFAQRSQQRVATCLVNIDAFKRINESLGERVGDTLLRRVSERVVGRLRMTDVIARLSPGDVDAGVSRLTSDSFAFTVAKLSDPHDAGRIARRVLDAVAEPFIVEKRELFVTASIGIAVYPEDGRDAPPLLTSARTALTCAKARGRNHYQFFAHSMNVEASRKLHLESRIRQALEHGEFRLHYQPMRDARTGRLTSAEALLRWEDPEMGSVSPAEFIPVSEETHVIGPLSLWVLRTACSQARAWLDAGYQPIRLAVNVSAVHLRDEDLAEQVAEILRETGFSPADLELEITESAMLDDGEATLASVRALRDLGIGLALDDFGTGYSSLSLLRRFSIDRVKIDRSFVCELPGNSEDATLTEAIIGMAHGLGIPVVAEGVETLAQAEFLRAHGCDDLQGYLISRPVPAEDLTSLLQREKEQGAAGETGSEDGS